MKGKGKQKKSWNLDRVQAILGKKITEEKKGKGKEEEEDEGG